ncbi:uncharacterized protein VTP21DRAFT_8216 [Calcarisporiella thermophila]|uniref:uncharacterized protein n=1 Tax=Calcarisporiella thermophila TaxID=911321 RepID=UPI003743AC24
MEPVLFYGVPHGCSFGSIVALEWLNVPYRLCRIEMPVDPNEETYVRVNPSRQTPALLTKDKDVLNESFAILHHLAALDLTKKLGFKQGTKEFDQLNYVLSFLHASFHPSWVPLFAPHKASDDPSAHEGIKAKALERVTRGYARIESILEGREWLVADGPTVADAYLYGISRWGEDLGLIDIKKDFPNIQKLREKMAKDKAVIFAHAIEDQHPATTSGQFLGHVSLEELKSLIPS